MGPVEHWIQHPHKGLFILVQKTRSPFVGLLCLYKGSPSLEEGFGAVAEAYWFTRYCSSISGIAGLLALQSSQERIVSLFTI